MESTETIRTGIGDLMKNPTSKANHEKNSGIDYSLLERMGIKVDSLCDILPSSAKDEAINMAIIYAMNTIRMRNQLPNLSYMEFLKINRRIKEEITGDEVYEDTEFIVNSHIKKIRALVDATRKRSDGERNNHQ